MTYTLKKISLHADSFINDEIVQRTDKIIELGVIYSIINSNSVYFQ